MSVAFIDKNRMESLVDGIFAVCMTILVLTIDFPKGLILKMTL
ncbi:MAG: TMEM175 family protein [Methanofastidiosum sp.]